MREQGTDQAKQPEQRREQQPKQLSKRRPMDTLSEENPLICRGID